MLCPVTYELCDWFLLFLFTYFGMQTNEMDHKFQFVTEMSYIFFFFQYKFNTFFLVELIHPTGLEQ